MSRSRPPRRPAETAVVALDINGILDLHHFHPREVPDLVREYLRECHRRDIHEIRIVHGKGKGVLRAVVHDILAHDPNVIAYGPATDRSGWGATIVRLRTHQRAETAKPPADVPKPTPPGGFWGRLWPWRR
ncbi:hypothetical protein BI364_06755 [Acidihalobacter yilgarnensis]|uniref:Smr domain-containing protein n=1 Tax=Acidihalobacter yilgarnensis TaxID=2819280 RepID=A0A1D8IMK7_9GAMM|nr:Smr/MutS family protein [Acidihalobacter yilgarnensis]AOU97698.1 hypothetical protein BI364_06755 [Acidihalobacter yilgarnensis]